MESLFGFGLVVALTLVTTLAAVLVLRAERGGVPAPLIAEVVLLGIASLGSMIALLALVVIGFLLADASLAVYVVVPLILGLVLVGFLCAALFIDFLAWLARRRGRLGLLLAKNRPTTGWRSRVGILEYIAWRRQQRGDGKQR